MIPIQLFIRELLGNEQHSRQIEVETAKILQAYQNQLGNTYHVQFIDHDGEALFYPVVWLRSAWLRDVESYRAAKHRAQQAQDARWIHEENIRRVTKRLMLTYPIPEPQARAAAGIYLRTIQTNNHLFTDVLKVNFVKDIKEITG